MPRKLPQVLTEHEECRVERSPNRSSTDSRDTQSVKLLDWVYQHSRRSMNSVTVGSDDQRSRLKMGKLNLDEYGIFLSGQSGDYSYSDPCSAQIDESLLSIQTNFIRPSRRSPKWWSIVWRARWKNKKKIDKFPCFSRKESESKPMATRSFKKKLIIFWNTQSVFKFSCWLSANLVWFIQYVSKNDLWRSSEPKE